jgi:hypothetical protein
MQACTVSARHVCGNLCVCVFISRSRSRSRSRAHSLSICLSLSRARARALSLALSLARARSLSLCAHVTQKLMRRILAILCSGSFICAFARTAIYTCGCGRSMSRQECAHVIFVCLRACVLVRIHAGRCSNTTSQTLACSSSSLAEPLFSRRRGQ